MPRDAARYWVGGASAFGGLVALIWLFTILAPAQNAAANPDAALQWMLVVKLGIAVGLAFAVTAMLRFALSPMLAGSAPPTQTAADADIALRSRIAPIVLGIGSAAIIVLALFLIVGFVVLAQTQSKDGVIANKIDALLTGVFSSVLLVFATWVGTVIAFYFTNESFRQAAQVARESASGLIERLRSLPIKRTMLPLKGIKLLKLKAGASLETADLAEVKAAFDQTSKDEPISRLLILDSADRFVAVMHRSMWSELLASDPDTGKALAAAGTQPASAASAGAAAQASQPAPPQTKIDLTLGKLISRPIPGTSSGGTYGDMLRKTVAFVVDKALADAKAATEALSGCQDVIVTQSGATTMHVIGWITNTRLARFSQA